MITMQLPSAGSLLPIPVLFSIIKPSAARYGHRTPEPHDRPAALPSKVHGVNRYGAVLVSFPLSPFVADRLKYGIQLSAAKHPDLLEWRPVSVPSQKPALPAPALEPSGKPVFQVSDDCLIQFAVDEDKRRAENGEDLLDMRERLLFLQKYRVKLSENHLRTKLMPQIRERAKRENVHLRGQGHIKQRFIK